MLRKSVFLLLVTIFLLTTMVQPSYAKVDKWKCTLSLVEVGLAWGSLLLFSGGTAAAMIALISWHYGNIDGWLSIASSCF